MFTTNGNLGVHNLTFEEVWVQFFFTPSCNRKFLSQDVTTQARFVDLLRELFLAVAVAYFGTGMLAGYFVFFKSQMVHPLSYAGIIPQGECCIRVRREMLTGLLEMNA